MKTMIKVALTIILLYGAIEAWVYTHPRDIICYNIQSVIGMDGQEGLIVYYAIDGKTDIAGPFNSIGEAKLYKMWLDRKGELTDLTKGVADGN